LANRLNDMEKTSKKDRFDKIKALREEICKSRSGKLKNLGVKEILVEELLLVKKTILKKDFSEECVIEKIDHIISLIDEDKESKGD